MTGAVASVTAMVPTPLPTAVLDAAFRDRAAFLRPSSTLVVADVHVGRAGASAVEFPLGERGDLVGRIEALLDRFSPEAVVFAGDVLHRFGGVSRRDERTLEALVASCEDAGARPLLVAGNHDTALAEVWDGSVRDAVRRGDALVCHGHEAPDENAPLYVVGHDHPAIRIEGTRRPCFLYGPETYRGGDVLMLPAFNRLAAGGVVNGMRSADFQSPLVTDADALRPVVYDADGEEVHAFPPLGSFRRML